MPRFMKKWWVEADLPNGKLLKGWLPIIYNVNSKDEIPKTITGTFWSENDGTMVRLQSGEMYKNIRGEFKLDSLDGAVPENFGSVLKTGYHGYVVCSVYQKYDGPSLQFLPMMNESDRDYWSKRYFAEDTPLPQWDRVEMRIEDALNLEKTYVETL